MTHCGHSKRDANLAIMKGKVAIGIAFAVQLISGCSVSMPVSEATARPLSNSEVALIGDHPSVRGKWFEVNVSLSRASASKIPRWELYTHIRVTDCDNGRTVSIVSPARVEGTEGDFGRLRSLLRSNIQRQTFVLNGPAFFQEGQSMQGLCVRIEGGSYTLQKIVSDNVPLILT